MSLTKNDLNQIKGIVTEAIDQQSVAINKAFSAVQDQFDRIDERFEQIDRRFEQVDKRFDRIESHLARHDLEFKAIMAKLEMIDNDIKALYELVSEKADKKLTQEFQSRTEKEILRINKNLKILAKTVGVKLPA